MSTLFEKYRDQGLVVLGLNGATQSDEDVRGFKRFVDAKHPLLYGASRVAVQGYGAVAHPSAVWIDKKGVIRHVERSGSTYAELEKLTLPLLK